MPLEPAKSRALDRLFYDLFNGAVDADALLHSSRSIPQQRQALSSGSGWLVLDDVKMYLDSARYFLKPDGTPNRDRAETADVDAKNQVAQAAKKKADALVAELQKAQTAAEEARFLGDSAAAAEADRLVAATKPDTDSAVAEAEELLAIADAARAVKQEREAQDIGAVTMVQALHRGNRAREAAKRGADALRAYATSLFPPPPPVEDDEDFDPSIPEHNRDIKVASGSLFIMSDEATLRHSLNRFLNGKPVDTFLLICILINVLILAIETPTATLRPAFVDLFYTVDFTLSVVFSIEMVLRIISLGFVLHPTAYLRTSWNVLDFVVVGSIWITWIIGWWDPELAEATNISYLRTARALRPLRSLRFFSGIKMIMTSLFSAIPMIASVVVLVGFFFIIFAATGLSLYQGATTRDCLNINHTIAIANNISTSMFNGTERDGVFTEYYDGEYIDWAPCPKTIQCDDGVYHMCHVIPYQYTGDLPDEINSFGFDNFRNAIMTVFIVFTLDEWPQLADPVRSAPLMASGTAWTFYALIVLTCSLLGANLFVAVVSFAFAHVVDEDGGSAFASGEVYEVPTKELTGAAALVKQRQMESEFSNPLSESKFSIGDVPTSFEQEENVGDWPKPGVRTLRSIVETSLFENFILVIVVLNTCALGAEHYDPEYHETGGMSPAFRDSLHVVEIVFTMIYVVELMMKMIALYPREYFSSGFNCLDFTLVVTTVLSWQIQDLKGFGAGRVLRLFRAARLIKLLKRFNAVRQLLRTVTKSVSPLLNVVFFIMVWLIIFAIMGIHLYGFDMPTFEEDGLPRDNFHSFGTSLLTCYVLLTGEDWSPLMFKYVKAFGWGSAIYFVAVIIMTKFVLINMFVAVILENFSTPDAEKLAIQQRKYEEDLARRMGAQVDDGDTTGGQSPTGLRLKVSGIINHSSFESFIILAIILSSACLAIEGPPDAEYLQDYDSVRTILGILDIVFFLIFWVECVLKVISMGFIGYLSDGWNKLDFSVVMMSTIDVALRLCESCSSYSWVKVFRVARVMRPLRVARRFKEMRIIVDSLLSAVGGVASVLALTIFIYLVFAIVGLNLFAGKFWTCQEEGFEGLSMVECKAANLTWANPDQHFDTMGDSMETLFVTATLEGWVEIMNRGMDVPNEIGEAPIGDNLWGACFYFVVFTILASFFVTNLFIGVLVNNFQESTGSAIMTDEQQTWAKFQMLLAVVSVEKSEKMLAAEMARASPMQQKLLPIMNSPRCEYFIAMCISLNALVLLSESYPQSDSYSSFVQQANLVFLIVFTLESAMQLLARGPVLYIRGHWFKLDVVVITCSWVLTILDIQAGQNAARLVRMLRVLMILKFAKMARNMVLTVIFALPPAFNVFLVQTLLLYIYGVAGMMLYGNLEECDKINDLQNFRNIFNAMMYLFQISTGQDFKSIMYDIRAQDGQFVAPFFISFYVLSIYVFLNLFVAVLLEAFEREFDDTFTLDIANEDLVEFKGQWDDKCEQLLHDGLVQGESGRCGRTTSKGTVPLKFLREFISTLPEDSELGLAREIGRGKTLDSIRFPAQIVEGVWWNRLLHELAVQEKSQLFGVPEHHIHEAEQGQADPAILSVPIEFNEVVIACQLMRSQAVAKMKGKTVNVLAQLTYQERVEMQAELDRKQRELAESLLRASIGAFRALRHPPPDIAEKIANDPTGNEQRIWSLQVTIGRTLMMATVINRQKVV